MDFRGSKPKDILAVAPDVSSDLLEGFSGLVGCGSQVRIELLRTKSALSSNADLDVLKNFINRILWDVEGARVPGNNYTAFKNIQAKIPNVVRAASNSKHPTTA
jgi:hypothetical protein